MKFDYNDKRLKNNFYDHKQIQISLCFKYKSKQKIINYFI